MIDQDDAVDVINSHFDELVNGKFSTAYLMKAVLRVIPQKARTIMRSEFGSFYSKL